MKTFYKTRATSVGGRTGHTEAEDGSLAFDLAKPGSGKKGTNPEQLFALAYAACFDSALVVAAERLKKKLEATKTSVEVGVGENGKGGYGLDVDLYVQIKGWSEAEARALVEATHLICPYSNAIRGNVEVRSHVTVI